MLGRYGMKTCKIQHLFNILRVKMNELTTTRREGMLVPKDLEPRYLKRWLKTLGTFIEL